MRTLPKLKGHVGDGNRWRSFRWPSGIGIDSAKERLGIDCQHQHQPRAIPDRAAKAKVQAHGLDCQAFDVDALLSSEPGRGRWRIRTKALATSQIPPGGVAKMSIFSTIFGTSFLVTVFSRASVKIRCRTARNYSTQANHRVGEFEVATGGGIWVAIRVPMQPSHESRSVMVAACATWLRSTAVSCCWRGRKTALPTRASAGPYSGGVGVADQRTCKQRCWLRRTSARCACARATRRSNRSPSRFLRKHHGGTRCGSCPTACVMAGRCCFRFHADLDRCFG